MMFTHKSSEPLNNLADQAAQSADEAIQATQRVASAALESLADAVQDLRQQAEPLLNRSTEQASALVQRGMDNVHHTSRQLRDKAQHASDATVDYIRDEPVKAILIAAATGAALMVLIGLISPSRSRG